ncbi:MAG: hypothetical protein GY949_02175, partial [Gammaproteobacteria bacterium]|nr:hypothetical protein [Gammaproteobacteria bacterium]
MTETDKAQEAQLVRSLASGKELAPLVLDLWQRTRMDWSFASDRLAEEFRRRRELGSSERRFIAETLYGMIRHGPRLDEALRAGGVRAASGASVAQRLLAYL